MRLEDYAKQVLPGPIFHELREAVSNNRCVCMCVCMCVYACALSAATVFVYIRSSPTAAAVCV